MILHETRKGNVIILAIGGRLDATSAPSLEEKLTSLLENEEFNILIDFSAIEYISSIGLRVLLVAAKKSGRAGGKVVICDLREQVREVFEIAGFFSIFPNFPSQTEALDSFEKTT